MMPGGLGSSIVSAGEASVGALAILNPVGDVFCLEGEALTGGDHVPGPPQLIPSDLTNTTLVALATDADAARVELTRLIVRSHDAIAACVRPSHTRYDGDAVFAASVGDITANHDELGEAVFVATARAIENAVRAANR
jgi:L-aminopeptidase/D-esterase-like protein